MLGIIKDVLSRLVGMQRLRHQGLEEIRIPHIVLLIICEANINTWNMSNLIFSNNTKDQLLSQWLHFPTAISGFALSLSELKFENLSTQGYARLDISVD
jgi:hypothetical protein